MHLLARVSGFGSLLAFVFVFQNSLVQKKNSFFSLSERSGALACTRE